MKRGVADFYSAVRTTCTKSKISKKIVHKNMTYFEQNEEKSGLRWTWNLLPANRIEASRIVVPISSLYTPLTPIKNMPVLKYDPVVCKNCRTILNPYCKVDYQSKIWVCPLCLTHNGFPQAFEGITPQRRPAELYQQYSTVEYVLRRNPSPPPFFIFVVDTCLGKDQLETLKESILMTLDLLPTDASVGLVTFGTTVQLYELGYSECSKAYVFRGDKSPEFKDFQDQLGISGENTQKQQHQEFVKRKFVVPLSDNEVNITTIIDDITADPWPVKPNTRDRRATGVALAIGTYLAETGFAGSGGHVMLFVGGACTLGDGKVVGLSKKEMIRLHQDIQNDNAMYYKKAVKFYQGLTQRLVKNGHVVDLFGANLDQIGVTELNSCIENTGGVLVITDAFSNPIFTESLKVFFEQDEDTGNLKILFNGTLEIQTSPSVKICGALGPITSMNQKSHCVSETEIGYGNTNAWKINCLSESSTVAIFFDLTKTSSSVGTTRYFQYVTAFQHSNGEARLRVCTTGLNTVQPQQYQQLAQGFDQKAAAVVMSRLAVYKSQSEYLFDVLRWLDRTLIRLVRRFGQYTKGNPESLSLGNEFTLFPQFMYHLRRGHFLRVFNNSPDETTFYRFYLNRENTKNSLTMIQPLVLLYTYDKPPRAVNLDSSMLQSRVILLLDCYDTVLIYHGGQIAQWREKKYHEMEEYASFKKLLLLPKADAKKIMEKRFPYPSFIDCDEGSSQARVIYSKVNPSTTHKTMEYGEGGGQSYKILTDDSSLQFFMKHLKELVVANE